MFDHPVGAIHESPKHIGAVGRGDSRIARAIRELPLRLGFFHASARKSFLVSARPT